MKIHWLMLMLALVICAGLAFVACGDDDDDDDDNDNDDAADDDDADEEPCLTEAKQDAETFCPTIGLAADLTHIGLDSVGLECQFYCGNANYFYVAECLGGTCICCI